MAPNKFTSSCLLFAAALAFAQALPLSTPCSQEEILAPVTNLHMLVEKMQSHDGEDVNAIMEQIEKEADLMKEHLTQVKDTCGEEKTMGVEKLEKVILRIEQIDDVIASMEAGELKKAKDMLETFDCEHMIQYIVRKYATNMEKMENTLNIIKMMDNMKTINMMNEALIYIMDDSNISIAEKLVPLMKEQIINNNKIMLMAKLNMKEVIKRTLPNCYEGLMALNELDSEMADQAMYEAMFQKTCDSIYSPTFNAVMGAPNAHFRVVGLQAIFDKLVATEFKDSVPAAKVLILAQNLMNNADLKEDEKANKILKSIMDESSLFAKNAAEGFSCQDIDHVKALKSGEPMEENEHNEHIVFYNPIHHEKIANAMFMENPEGDMVMITFEKQIGEGKTTEISLLMDKGDYPEDIKIKGKITSKKVLGKEPATEEEICAMNPKPDTNICIPMMDILSWTMEEAVKHRDLIYDSYQEHIEGCNAA